MLHFVSALNRGRHGHSMNIEDVDGLPQHVLPPSLECPDFARSMATNFESSEAAAGLRQQFLPPDVDAEEKLLAVRKMTQ